jgi:cytoskeletal protein RodZ
VIEQFTVVVHKRNQTITTLKEELKMSEEKAKNDEETKKELMRNVNILFWGGLSLIVVLMVTLITFYGGYKTRQQALIEEQQRLRELDAIVRTDSRKEVMARGIAVLEDYRITKEELQSIKDYIKQNPKPQ